MCRNLRQNKNPMPRDWGVDLNNVWVPPKESRNSEIAKVFGIRSAKPKRAWNG
jgi:hypothetical protein